jgi:adenosine kinase
MSSKKIPYLYDPAFQIGDFSTEELREGIESSAIFIGNDYEIALVEQKLKVTHEQLLKMAKIIVTTLGAKGSLIEIQQDKFEVGIAQAKNISDPTGAGDAYRGGFLAGYLRGFDLKTCGQMGAVASVYTVEQYGTMTHTYSQKNFVLGTKKTLVKN